MCLLSSMWSQHVLSVVFVTVVHSSHRWIFQAYRQRERADTLGPWNLPDVPGRSCGMLDILFVFMMKMISLQSHVLCICAVSFIVGGLVMYWRWLLNGTKTHWPRGNKWIESSPNLTGPHHWSDHNPAEVADYYRTCGLCKLNLVSIQWCHM